MKLTLQNKDVLNVREEDVLCVIETKSGREKRYFLYLRGQEKPFEVDKINKNKLKFKNANKSE